MTPAEQRLLGRAAVVLLLSGLLRWGLEVRRGPPTLPEGLEDQGPRLLAEARALAAEEERRGTPLGPDEKLDPNRAPEVELDRLPGVGPAIAAAVVAAREEGAFAGPDDLLRVRGIGPATLERLREHLEFGPVRATGPGVLSRSSPRASDGGRAASRGTPVVSGAPPGEAAGEAVDINRATEEALTALPGIGPALAARIVEERSRRGGFGAVEEPTEVRGIGPATLERLRPRVRLR